MKRYVDQELYSGFLFFATCGWLIFDIVLSAPQQAPALWPLIPMFVAIVWYVSIEQMRLMNRH